MFRCLTSFTLVSTIIDALKKNNNEFFCPNGYDPYKTQCRSKGESCYMKDNVPEQTYKLGHPPEVQCARGYYDDGRCWFEDWFRPDVLCPPGWDLRLLTFLPDPINGGWYKPTPQEMAEMSHKFLIEKGRREYICEQNIKYNAVPYCFGENAFVWNESCRHHEIRYPKPECLPGFTYYDELELCIEDEPLCPKGLTLRFVADKHTFKYLYKNNAKIAKKSDLNRDGIIDLHVPLEAICVSLPELVLQQPAKLHGTAIKGQPEVRKANCGDNFFFDEELGCFDEAATGIKGGLAQLPHMEFIERKSMPPYPRCLTRGGLYDKSDGMCHREFTDSANWRCAPGDLLNNDWNRKPHCVRSVQVPASVSCDKGSTLESDWLPEVIRQRNDFKHKRNPGISRPWCKRLVSEPALFVCKQKDYTPLTTNKCVKFKEPSKSDGLVCEKTFIDPMDCSKGGCNLKDFGYATILEVAEETA